MISCLFIDFWKVDGKLEGILWNWKSSNESFERQMKVMKTNWWKFPLESMNLRYKSSLISWSQKFSRLAFRSQCIFGENKAKENFRFSRNFWAWKWTIFVQKFEKTHEMLNIFFRYAIAKWEIADIENHC